MNTLPDSGFWTVPNALSLSRLALLPVWWWIMITPAISDWWGGGLIVYAIISDVLDGYLARRLGQTSAWGRILDPVGDKVAALVVAVFCVYHRDMPVSAFWATAIRDILLVIGGGIWYRRGGLIPASVNIGRYAALVWGIVLLLYAFNWQPYAGFALWPGVGLYLAAGFVYLRSALSSRRS